MTKSQLVEEVCRLTGYSITTVSTVFESIVENISDALSNGEDITISNFGVFSPEYRAPKIGRNPHTGEEIPIPGQYVPVFKPSSALRSKVKQRCKK